MSKGFLILTFGQFNLLKTVIEAGKSGLYVGRRDGDLDGLASHGLIRGGGLGYVATEAGLEHVFPKQLLARL